MNTVQPITLPAKPSNAPAVTREQAYPGLREPEYRPVCIDCGISHLDQLTAFPVNARIKAICIIYQGHTNPAYSFPNIPVGALGTITGHCDNGRACVSFDNVGPGHTFHFPNGYIELA